MIDREPNHFNVLEATSKHFITSMSEGDPVHQFYPHHVKQVEKWARRILDYYPDADREVVLLSVWLHDIGAKDKNNLGTHEIYSENEARRFLPTLGLAQDKVDAVAHCVRTHRCKEDALPETTEAAIVAAADSASHLTDIFYILMLIEGNSKEAVLQKLDRDIRDTQSLPEPLHEELLPLHNIWKELITSFPE